MYISGKVIFELFLGLLFKLNDRPMASLIIQGNKYGGPSLTFYSKCETSFRYLMPLSLPILLCSSNSFLSSLFFYMAHFSILMFMQYWEQSKTA